MVEKALFLSQIFEMEILIDLHIWGRLPESENHISSGCSVSVTSITLKQIIAETTNLVVYIYIMYMLLESFHENQTVTQYRGTQKNFNTLQPMDGYSS